jgi:hypothetical protein
MFSVGRGGRLQTLPARRDNARDQRAHALTRLAASAVVIRNYSLPHRERDQTPVTTDPSPHGPTRIAARDARDRVCRLMKID